MKINFKRGSGASLLGLSLIVLMFALCLCMTEEFNFNYAGIYTQTRTDAIGDAMAATAFVDVRTPPVYAQVWSAGNTVNQKNRYVSGALSKTQIVDMQIDANELIENKVLSLKTQAITSFLNKGIFKNGENGIENNTFYTYGKNKTRFITGQTSETSFPIDYHYKTHPTITSNDPSNLTADKYEQILYQFDVEMMDRYVTNSGEGCEIKGNENSKAGVYLWDVTSALGCELPLFYDKTAGKPAKPDDNGSYENGLVSRTKEVGSDKNGSARSYIEYCNKYMPCINSSDLSSNHWEGLNGWSLINNNGSMTGYIRTIQNSANNGNPTVLLYTDGRIEFVIPAFGANPSGSLVVSYAANKYVDGATNNTMFENRINDRYDIKVPFGNFIAITYL